MIALADEPASPSRDRQPAGSRLRPRDSGIERRDAARRNPCGESLKACKDARQFLRDDDIASIDLDIRVGGIPGNDYPCECRLEGETFQPRRFASTTMTWKAAGYCHKPLYFEDWELERYGHSRGMFLDPFIAGAHFFVTLPILPYKAGMQAPWECVYPLGYYRPEAVLPGPSPVCRTAPEGSPSRPPRSPAWCFCCRERRDPEGSCQPRFSVLDGVGKPVNVKHPVDRRTILKVEPAGLRLLIDQLRPRGGLEGRLHR